MLQDLKPIVHTMTVNGRRMKLRFDMNALDYLERVAGGLDKALGDGTILGKKQVLRAAMLCNYPENLARLDRGELEALRPGLSELGEWFDLPTVEAISEELYKVALEQMEAGDVPGEAGPPSETLAAVIGALCKLYGWESLDEAMRSFGAAPRGRS